MPQSFSEKEASDHSYYIESVLQRSSFKDSDFMMSPCTIKMAYLIFMLHFFNMTVNVSVNMAD